MGEPRKVQVVSRGQNSVNIGCVEKPDWMEGFGASWPSFCTRAEASDEQSRRGSHYLDQLNPLCGYVKTGLKDK